MRKAIGLTQEEFATLLKMMRRQIAEIEGGKANPTLDTLERIGTLFGFATVFVPISAKAGQPDDQNSARTNFEDLMDRP